MEENFIKNSSGHTVFKIIHSTATDDNICDMHRHTAFEVSLILCGSGVCVACDRTYEFKKDDIFVFSSNETHCITDIQNAKEFEYITISFEPIFLWSEDYGINSSALSKIFLERDVNFSNRLERKNTATEKIKKLICDMNSEFVRKSEEYELAAKAELITMLITLKREFDCVKKDDFPPLGDDLKFCLKRAVGYMNDNLDKDFTLESLALAANMSRSRFCTIFKKYNGISPWEYITVKRIERSLELLKDRDLTKLQITNKCGFNNTSNFYRAFKKVTGKTPTDFLSKNVQ